MKRSLPHCYRRSPTSNARGTVLRLKDPLMLRLGNAAMSNHVVIDRVKVVMKGGVVVVKR